MPQGDLLGDSTEKAITRLGVGQSHSGTDLPPVGHGMVAQQSRDHAAPTSPDLVSHQSADGEFGPVVADVGLVSQSALGQYGSAAS